jgi:hypothetical protein
MNRRENFKKRINKMIFSLETENVKNIGRMHKKDFTRNYLLTIPLMILIALNKQGQGLTMELYNFAKKVKMVENGKTISKQTYSAARKKLNPQIFKMLNENYLNRIYSIKGAYKTFKGYMLIACDGSKPVLPNIKSLRRWFGGEKCDDGIIRSTNGNMSVLYDCLNHFILDLVIDKYKTSEKTLIKRKP